MKRKPSRQALRTRKLLEQALVTLIQEREYASLRIEDITEEADVGRATFYMHYRDKDDLLATVVEKSYQDVIAHLAGSEQSTDMLGVQSTLAHIRQQPNVYRVIFDHGPTLAKIRRFIVSQLSAQLQDVDGLTPSRVAMIAHYVAGAILGMFRWWLDNETDQSVEEVVAFIRQMTISCIVGSRDA